MSRHNPGPTPGTARQLASSVGSLQPSIWVFHKVGEDSHSPLARIYADVILSSTGGSASRPSAIATDGGPPPPLIRIYADVILSDMGGEGGPPEGRCPISFQYNPGWIATCQICGAFPLLDKSAFWSEGDFWAHWSNVLNIGTKPPHMRCRVQVNKR